MGYRTHFTLSIEGKPQTVGTFKDMPTQVYLLDNYCICKCYLNELPEELQEHLESYPGLFFNDGGESDDGEIKLSKLLALLREIQRRRNGLTDDQIEAMHAWYWFDPVQLLTHLERALADGLITEKTWVKFTCY